MATNVILQWQHDRQAKIQMARSLLDGVSALGRDMNGEEEKRYNDLLAEADKLQGKIEQERRLQAHEADLAAPQRRAAKPNPENPLLDMPDSDIRQYSILRAINAMATGDWRNAQLEMEASEAMSKRYGISPQGILIPFDVMAGTKAQREQRDLTKGTNTAGGYMVATNLLADSFIDILRNRSVLLSAGATLLDGLIGDVAIPRQTSASTAYWVAENAALTESQPAFDQVAMAPKTLGGYVDISRKLIKQSSIGVENFVRTDLTRILAIEKDRAGLHGSGSGGQPTGVAGQSGVNLVALGTNGAAPTWATMVQLETEVAVDNADIDPMAYICNAKTRGKLKTTPKEAGTNDTMIWDVRDRTTPVNGYPALVTNQVASNLTKGTASGICSALFFGNWRDLIFGMWGAIDLLVDPFTGGTAGTVRVIALDDIDVAVRHPESFALSLDVLTT